MKQLMLLLAFSFISSCTYGHEPYANKGVYGTEGNLDGYSEFPLQRYGRVGPFNHDLFAPEVPENK